MKNIKLYSIVVLIACFAVGESIGGIAYASISRMTRYGMRNAISEMTIFMILSAATILFLAYALYCSGKKIAAQNATIAAQNATIAAQNAKIAAQNEAIVTNKRVEAYSDTLISSLEEKVEKLDSKVIELETRNTRYTAEIIRTCAMHDCAQFEIATLKKELQSFKSDKSYSWEDYMQEGHDANNF